jgi:predicted metal-binding membrane protein
MGKVLARGQSASVESFTSEQEGRQAVNSVRAVRSYEIAAGLLLAAGLAWWWTAERMAGMGAGPGTGLGGLGWFTTSWVVMMAAMMLPSFAPTIAAYVSSAGRRWSGRPLLFTAGYLLAWTAAGVCAYAVFELGHSLLAGDLAWHSGGRWLSAGLLAAAAAYEFMPLKRACLGRCRGELARPHDEAPRAGAATLLLGVRSGGWCIGCSVALMAALFALGVMSLSWMAMVAGLVALQKVGPWPLAARLTTAVVLALLAAAVLLAPHDVPGLVVPGSGGMHAMPAMKAMG